MASQSQSPLRRWKPFFRTFDTIDAAIVASKREQEVGCAEELRQAKGDVVQLLCDAPDDDPAEEFCQILDQIMIEYLVTLKTVPVTPTALATTDLAMAVGFLLEEHESEQIRGLARDIVQMWRSSVERDLAEAKSRLEELRKLSDDQDLAPPKTRVSDDGEKKRRAKDAPAPPRAKAACVARINRVEPAAKRDGPVKTSAPFPKKGAPVVVAAGRANIGKTKPPAAIGNNGKTVSAVRISRGDPARRDGPARVSAPSPLPKKSAAPVVGAGRVTASAAAYIDKANTPAAVGNGRGDHAGIDRMMESAKRKLREGYQEAADAKRRRKIQVIQAPKIVERKVMHPVPRERSRAGCGAPTAVRRSLVPSFQRS
ncbi:hypothetical protein PR202_gb28316 [Eleusine coracana subsp. coracana]|uniref:TFIIS N-terminal domain-containing protein n=1 Tax=Eleusine coracana subsp. coracana TaxID=191504 RepID=A0AAV5FW20_ELECO|nr:hypothetical protein PR202_gb28316 [Eleusine coracana subsp. coracana]